MKRPSFLKRFAIVLLALLMALSLLLTGCSAEEVDLAIDIADAVLAKRTLAGAFIADFGYLPMKGKKLQSR